MPKDQFKASFDVNALNEDDNLFGLVFSYMNAGLVIADMQQEDEPIVYANPKFYEMTGFDEDEIIGKNCRFLQGQDTDKRMVNSIRNTIKKRKKGKFILKNYRKDKTIFWNELYLAPIFSKDGKCTHYVGIQHDVSDEIKYELD